MRAILTKRPQIGLIRAMKYVLLALMFLAACGGEEYRPRQGGGEALLDLEFDERAQVYAQTCETRGLPQGSEEFDQCVYEMASEYNLAQVRRDFYNKALD